MANVKQAIDYVLRFEDSTLAGVITSRRDADGNTWLTRFGIDQQYHQDLSNCLFYGSMGSVAALKIAESIYTKEYADPLCIADITNQDIADKLLSIGVNCGVVTVAKMLQDALHVSGDGRIGPLTLHALDVSDPEAVLGLLKNEAVQHYNNLIAANPSLEEYRAGWLARAEA
jgi:lysozyme family protein